MGNPSTVKVFKESARVLALALAEAMFGAEICSKFRTAAYGTTAAYCLCKIIRNMELIEGSGWYI